MTVLAGEEGGGPLLCAFLRRCSGASIMEGAEERAAAFLACQHRHPPVTSRRRKPAELAVRSGADLCTRQSDEAARVEDAPIREPSLGHTIRASLRHQCIGGAKPTFNSSVS